MPYSASHQLQSLQTCNNTVYNNFVKLDIDCRLYFLSYKNAYLVAYLCMRLDFSRRRAGGPPSNLRTLGRPSDHGYNEAVYKKRDCSKEIREMRRGEAKAKFLQEQVYFSVHFWGCICKLDQSKLDQWPGSENRESGTFLMRSTLWPKS